MNESSFWVDGVTSFLIFLIGLRLILQFKKATRGVKGYLALSYFSFSLFYFLRIIFRGHIPKLGLLHTDGLLISMSSFSLLALFLILLIPEIKGRVKTFARFPIGGALLGGYVGLYYGMLSFLVVQLVLIFLMFLKGERTYRILGFQIYMFICFAIYFCGINIFIIPFSILSGILLRQLLARNLFFEEALKC